MAMLSWPCRRLPMHQAPPHSPPLLFAPLILYVHGCLHVTSFSSARSEYLCIIYVFYVLFSLSHAYTCTKYAPWLFLSTDLCVQTNVAMALVADIDVLLSAPAAVSALAFACFSQNEPLVCDLSFLFSSRLVLLIFQLNIYCHGSCI
jgi:hypothetical protein